jgi:hypothetical protein
MYTSKKRMKEMMKEAASFLGVETAAEVFSHSRKASAFFARKLEKHGFLSIQFSPYKDGEWTLSGIIPGETRFFFKTLELEDWMDSPSETARMIIGQYGKS